MSDQRDGGITWTEETWNPIRGCSRVSEGCRNCYAERVAARFSGPGQPYEGLIQITSGGPRWNGKVAFVEERLADPLRWKKPRMIFVNSMSDLFHESLSNEQIAAIFGVMAAAPQHTFQVLTKRARRMREWFALEGIAARVDLFRYIALAGRIEEFFAPEREAPVDGWPGYWITTKGRVLSDHKGERRPLSPMGSEQGHARVMLYRGDETWRPLVHRLVLGTFDKGAVGAADCDNPIGCHIDGDASNNALWNLRWGSPQSNWNDSKRHGTRRRYSKLTAAQADEIRRRGAAGESGAALGRAFGISDTQARNIMEGRQWAPEYSATWPLPSVWLGVSVEDQATADERIPHLLATPAAVRWVSYEPALGPVHFQDLFYRMDRDEGAPAAASRYLHASECLGFCEYGCGGEILGGLDWIVIGGESGPGARPFDVAWARATIAACRAAGVKVFFKQAGSNAIENGARLALRDRKGGDPAEWPEDLRVREWPSAEGAR